MSQLPDSLLDEFEELADKHLIAKTAYDLSSLEIGYFLVDVISRLGAADDILIQFSMRVDKQITTASLKNMYDVCKAWPKELAAKYPGLTFSHFRACRDGDEPDENLAQWVYETRATTRETWDKKGGKSWQEIVRAMIKKLVEFVSLHVENWDEFISYEIEKMKGE